jgi:hypothetical protein
MGLISIQTNSTAVVAELIKTEQLQMKLTHTAAVEIELLSVFHRRVNNVMRTALASGASGINQGISGFIGPFDPRG